MRLRAHHRRRTTGGTRLHASHLSRRDAARRVASLRAEIRRHDERYYVQGRPTISDEAYDRLVAELRSIERAHPELVTPESPTQRVGGRVARPFASVRHAAPMLSLEATHIEADVAGFIERLHDRSPRSAFVLEPKLDGLSVELVYVSGLLVAASTRGDGITGEDVSTNARTIDSVPASLRGVKARLPERVSIRGEMLMPRSHFARINRELTARGEDAFANPRNAAAGSLRQLDPAITARRGLRFVAYEIMASQGFDGSTDRAALAALRRWGFVIPARVRSGRSAEQVQAYHESLMDSRESLDYEIDGIVIKADSLELRTELGATSHHPRWAIAYKFAPRAETTIVEDIVFQVGRSGVLTPVALLRPVDISGVTVSRATLHNLDELHRRDIRIGDRVRVQRAGDVIPEIVEREKSRRRRAVRVPSRCPACRTRLVHDGPALRCPNRWSCPAQLIAALTHLASDDAFSIPGLGLEVARHLVDLRLVRSLPDLFALDATRLRRIPGFAERSAEKLASAIDDARRVDLARFLLAIGIPGVGKTAARALATRLRTLAAVRRASRAVIDAVPGIGPRQAAVIAAFLHDRRTARAITAFARAGVRVHPPDSAHRR